MSRLREGRANTARGAAHFLRGDGGTRALRRGQRTTHATGRQRVLHSWRGIRLPQDGCPLLHHHPPAQKPAQSHRGDTRRCLDADSLLDGRLPPMWPRPPAPPSRPRRTPRRVRLVVRRVKPTPGSQPALFAKYSYHGFITDRDGELLEPEADHRRHAGIENAIRDLKYGVGLNHLPSGRFAANGAWLAGPDDGPLPGPLDGADRSGRADSHHQDPPAAVLLPGRTAHPLGTPVDPASSGSLALG